MTCQFYHQLLILGRIVLLKSAKGILIELRHLLAFLPPPHSYLTQTSEKGQLHSATVQTFDIVLSYWNVKETDDYNHAKTFST